MQTAWLSKPIDRRLRWRLKRKKGKGKQLVRANCYLYLWQTRQTSSRKETSLR